MMATGKVVRLQRALDDPETVARLREMRLDLGLHKSGNIYRKVTIDCFRFGILNAHIGLFPKYRGRSVMEWSLVQGDPVGISVFFIDEGIDTGARIVLSETVDISHCETLSEARHYLFDLDATFYRRAIERLASENVLFESNDGSGRRYYVMSRLFREVAEGRLEIGNQK
jgi:methionyl-tRNA formyltransferase